MKLKENNKEVLTIKMEEILKENPTINKTNKDKYGEV